MHLAVGGVVDYCEILPNMAETQSKEVLPLLRRYIVDVCGLSLKIQKLWRATADDATQPVLYGQECLTGGNEIRRTILYLGYEICTIM